MAVPQFSEVPDAQHRSKALGFFMSVAPTTTLVDIHFFAVVNTAYQLFIERRDVG